MTSDVSEAPNFAPSSTAFVLDADRPVLAHHRRMKARSSVDPHHHPRSQLIWASDGVCRVTSGENVWIVPPSHAVWIPGNLLHDVITETEAHFRNLYIDPSAVDVRPGLAQTGCRVLTLTPLMRELIVRLCDSDLAGPFDERLQRLCAVALDEIATLPEAPLSLPGGRDPRVVRLTRHLGLHPEDGRSFSELAQLAGASPRNLERLFLRETGLTLRQWRIRAKLLSAIERLNDGQSSTQIAHALGYSGASAFVSAFRQQFGRPPQSFLGPAQER